MTEPSDPSPDTVEVSMVTSMDITSIDGRGSGPKDGRAAAHLMRLKDDAGNTMDMRRVRHPGRTDVQVNRVAFANIIQFGHCPICLTPNPTSREHVPPKTLGGTVITYTCEPCNNRFGSVIEPDLLNWYEDAFTNVRIGHENVHGARKSRRALHRKTSDGTPFLYLEDGIDSKIHEQIRPGATLDVTYDEHDMARVKLAVLKSTYLGACALMKQILVGPEADQVRHELMAVRDLRRNDPLPPLGPAARSIVFARSDEPTDDKVLLVLVKPSNGTAPYAAVSLRGAIIASWVFGGALQDTQAGVPVGPPLRLGGFTVDDNDAT